MAFQSLYRRYRPQRFSEVKGQDHVTTTLRNAVRDGRVAHAYLFSGPRGTGKTSTARILAKALNCENPQDGEPCDECASCVDIRNGSSVDVHELDAASNNGVDAMRDLVSRAALGTSGRWKIYIVDEVHMLTAGASNALLKTLEEPPGHVIFVLATTDPQKVLPTITSRTQHFEFRLLPNEVLVRHLNEVNERAGLGVAPEAIEIVARRGSGSARDALSVLDQVAAAGGIEDEGSPGDAIVEALCERDSGAALVAVATACGSGKDIRQLTRDVIDHLREAFLTLMSRGLVSRPDVEVAHIEDQGRRLGTPATVRAIELLGEALVDMREAIDPRIVLEVALVRLASPEADVTVPALLERIERLERKLAGQVVGPEVAAAREAVAPAAAPPRPAPSPPGTAPRPGPPPPRLAPSVPADDPAAAPSPSSPAPSPSSEPAAAPAPAAAARSALGASAKLPPAPPRARPTAPPPPPPRESTVRAAVRPQSSTHGEDDAASGGLPSRDELVLAWPKVLASLTGSKARFSAGRFLENADGAAVFALPNAVHRNRCEERRADAEAALAAQFGRRVPLKLVVDSAGETPPEAPPEEEAGYDVMDLEDAPPAVTSIDHLTQAFPGAELVEE